MTVSSLARYWTSNAQPSVQQADVLGVALDMPIGIAVLFDPCGLLVEKLWEVAGVVDAPCMKSLDKASELQVPTGLICSISSGSYLPGNRPIDREIKDT
jgi:hypothetical protein